MNEYVTSKKTRSNIINAAGEIAAKSGLTNVSMRAIAKRSGENIGSIHYHFGSKDNLFKEVIKATLKSWIDDPLSEYIAPLQSDLETKQGQTGIIRAIVHYQIKILFNYEKPVWHHKIMYHVLQYPSKLRDLVNETLIKPNDETVFKVFRKIRPSIKKLEMELQIRLIIAPLLFHVIFRDILLSNSGLKDYNKRYLQNLEDKITNQTLHEFNLPTNF